MTLEEKKERIKALYDEINELVGEDGVCILTYNMVNNEKHMAVVAHIGSSCVNLPYIEFTFANTVSNLLCDYSGDELKAYAARKSYLMDKWDERT